MARSPRRSFSAPFVITLAAVPAACTMQPSPQAPTTVQQPTTAPPQPGPQPPPDLVENPPRPQPAEHDTFWYVTQNGAECQATLKLECPTPEPGKPAMTCNPPPPVAYACPAGWDGTSQLIVTQYQGNPECIIEAKAPPCAPNEKCRKAASQPVPCPSR